MHKVEKKCKNCKFCKLTKGNRVCTSTWSDFYMEDMYEDDTCEVFAMKYPAKKIRKALVSVLSLLLVFSLTGCALSGDPVKDKYTNEIFMTDLEYKELYANELRSKVNKERSIEPVYVEMYDVNDEVKEILYNKIYETLKDLNMNIGYTSNYYIHENFKFLLDNLIQTGQMDIKMATNCGYYYVTINSKFIKNEKIDEMKKTANYLGINGAIGKNANNEEAVDEIYLKLLIDEVNANRASKNQDPVDTEIEQINYLEDIDVNTFFDNEEFVATIGTASETIKKDEHEQYEEDLSKINLFNEIQNDEEIKENKKDHFGRTVRRLNYNAEEFNNIAGISSQTFPLIPTINAIFRTTQNEKLSGYSLYNWGETIKEVREHPEKDIQLVFVFKHDLISDDYVLRTFYPMSIDTGLIVEENLKFVSDFLKQQIEIKLEEVHRALCDTSISTLTSGEYIYPQDLGIYLLKYRDTYSLLSSDMWLDHVIRREGDNTYLCEVKQLSTETIKVAHQGANSENIKELSTTGTRYLKTWLMRFRVEGTNCLLDDMYMTSLKCLRIPEMDLDKGALKKLYSIKNTTQNNLTDEIKETIKVELDKLAKGLTYKCEKDILDDKGNIQSFHVEDLGFGVYKLVNGKRKFIKGFTKGSPEAEAWGFLSRLNPDTTILSSRTREEYINDFATRVSKYGSNTPCTVTIIPTSFLTGGYDQVELTVRALFDYGDSGADILDLYMVFSNFKNKWHIDEITYTGDIIEGEGKKDAKLVRNEFEAAIKNK